MFSLVSLRLLSVFLIGALADPAPVPGRIPKVYNALITSNQNLEPSKAYPVYQPVLHEAFGFPFQPAIFYGGDLIGNGLLPQPGLPPKGFQASEASTTSSPSSPATPNEAPTEAPTGTAESEKPAAESQDPKSTSLVPPKTESPILLNAFGLPPQVLPLGHVDPVFNTLPQFHPFAYPYSGLRFYDPYDPFGYSFPSLYRPLPNVLGPNFSAFAPVATAEKKPENAPTETSNPTSSSEPSDLNILNYSSKDPAIPNVPPPPLPQGGLKSDKTE